MNKETKIIIVRESFLQSLLSDLSTFSFLIGTVWFNYIFIGNSKFINAVILIMFIVFLFQISKAKTFTSKEKAMEYIKN